MAIQIKYALNMACQYNEANEFDIEDYLVADNTTGKLFLTESPSKRVLNEAEKSALYFLIDDSNFIASAFYEMYDSSGNKIDEKILELGYNHLIHNAIPVNLNAVSVDPLTERMDISLISNQEILIDTDNLLSASWDIETEVAIIGGQLAPDGSEAFSLEIESGGFFGQTTPIGSGSQTFSFWVKSNALIDQPFRLFQNGGLSFSPNLTATSQWQRFEYTVVYTNQSVGITNDSINTNPVNLLIWNPSLRSTSINRLTEIKSYEIDRACYSYTFQVNWLNKLGGRDTWMFGAKPIITTDVQRNELIELSKLRNFESPKRILGYRQHLSQKTYTLAHQCKDQETAEWLKRELIDSIDVMIVINDYYYPVNVVNIQSVEDKSSKSYFVNFQFRLAFYNNIQTR